MDKSLSLADMARHFSLPESTARYYCKRFSPFMVIYGEGRRKRYGEECLQVISTIIEHMKMGKTAHMVEDVLAARYPRIMDAAVTRAPSFSTLGASFDTSASSQATTAPSQTVYGETATTHEMTQYTQGYAEPMPASMPHGGHMPHPMEGPAGQMFMKYMEQQSSALQSIADSLSVLASQKNDMQRMEDAARTAKEENILLRDEVKVLKNLLHSSEQVHHDDLSQMRTWMSRLAQSYNNKTTMDAQNQEGKKEGE